MTDRVHQLSAISKAARDMMLKEDQDALVQETKSGAVIRAEFKKLREQGLSDDEIADAIGDEMLRAVGELG